MAAAAAGGAVLTVGLMTIPPVRDLLLMTNDCPNCHRGSCDLHDYFNFELAADVNARNGIQSDEDLRHAMWIIRNLPTELQINVLVFMQPLTSTSLMDIPPFKQIWAAHETVIKQRILDTHGSRWKAYFPFRPSDRPAHYTTPSLDSIFSFSQYFLFIEKTRYATSLITQFLMQNFEMEAATLKRAFEQEVKTNLSMLQLVFNCVFHLWCYFSYMPSCHVADRERSIWNYLFNLPKFQQKGLRSFLYVLGRAYSKKYPVTYDGRLPNRCARELQFYQVEESCLIPYMIMERLRQGMRLVRCQVFDSRPVDLNFAFGDPATWWTRRPLPTVRIPATYKFVSQDTYVVRFNGTRSQGSIDLWIPTVDMFKGILMAFHRLPRMMARADVDSIHAELSRLQYRIARWDYWNLFESRPVPGLRGVVEDRKLYLDRLFHINEHET